MSETEMKLIRSEQISDWAVALAKAKLNYGTVVRTKENTFTHSKYAELQDLMDAIQKPLATEGLSFVHFPIEKADNKRAGALTLLIHSSGQYMGNELILPAVGKAQGGAEKFDAQTIAAAITYAKRYNVQGLGDVVGESEDDADSITDKSDSRQPVPPTKTVSAPPVSKIKASTGGDRPQSESRRHPDQIKTDLVPKAIVPQEPVQAPAVQQPAAQTGDLGFSEVTPDQNAQFHPQADNKSANFDAGGPPNIRESATSEQNEPAKPADKSEKPSKSQLDTYVNKIRDDIRPALEKAGLKASKGLAVGAKLKNYLLSANGAKELTDLSIKQWDAFIKSYETTDSASFASLVEGGNK